MKAFQIVKPYEFRIIEIEEPHPENDEVVIQLEYAAILELFGCAYCQANYRKKDHQGVPKLPKTR